MPRSELPDLNIVIEPADVAARTQAECTARYMERTRQGTVFAAVQNTFMAGVFWRSAEDWHAVLAWWLLQLLAALANGAHAHRFAQRPRAAHTLPRWRRRQIALQGLGGLAFGSCMLWVQGDIQTELLLTSVLVATSAIVAFNLLPYVWASSAFMLGVWAVPFWLCLARPTPIHLQLAVCIVFLSCALPIFVRRTSREVIRGVERSYEAALYAESLADATTRIHTLATRDELTSLLNRREGMRLMEAQHARLARSVSVDSLSVLMLDIDHFKAINDGHGHAGGDAALREVSHRLAQALRPGDLIARFGGEEFVIMRARATRDSALLVAERLRHVVADAPLQLSTTDLSVSVSIGLADLHADESLQDALVRADAALYAAKRAGRNRVVAAPPCSTLTQDAAAPRTAAHAD